MVLRSVSCQSVRMPKLILTDQTTDRSEETLITHAMNIMFRVTMRGQLLVVRVISILGSSKGGYFSLKEVVFGARFLNFRLLFRGREGFF